MQVECLYTLSRNYMCNIKEAALGDAAVCLFWSLVRVVYLRITTLR